MSESGETGETELCVVVCGVSLRILVPAGPACDAIAARFTGRAHGYGEVLPEERSLHVRVDGRIAHVEHAGHLGSIDLEAGEIRAPASLLVADTLVRAAVAWRLAERGAFHLHASAVRMATRRGVSACVFFGASGAGKSTLASHYGDIVSDELTQLSRSSEAPSAPWQASPTPWWRGGGEPVPLGGLVWLVRGEEPSARRVDGSELLRALMREAGRYFPVPEFQARLFDLCAHLAAQGAIRVAAGEGRVVSDVQAALGAG
jgi:hypothetical protein